MAAALIRDSPAELPTTVSGAGGMGGATDGAIWKEADGSARDRTVPAPKRATRLTINFIYSRLQRTAHCAHNYAGSGGLQQAHNFIGVANRNLTATRGRVNKPGSTLNPRAAAFHHVHHF